MSKGTAKHGLHSRSKTHITCRRCGERAYHAAHKECASCGYGKSARKRGYNWQR